MLQRCQVASENQLVQILTMSVHTIACLPPTPHSSVEERWRWRSCAGLMDEKQEQGVVQNESWLSELPRDGPGHSSTHSAPGSPLKGSMLEPLWSGIKGENVGTACSLVPTSPLLNCGCQDYCPCLCLILPPATERTLYPPVSPSSLWSLQLLLLETPTPEHSRDLYPQMHPPRTKETIDAPAEGNFHAVCSTLHVLLVVQYEYAAPPVRLDPLPLS